MVINWNITGLGVQLGLFMGIHTYIYIYIYIHGVIQECSWNICSYSHGNNICITTPIINSVGKNRHGTSG